MDPQLRIVTLGVRDLGAARHFYVDGLGWTATLDLPEVVFVQVGPGVLLALFGQADLDADVGTTVSAPDDVGVTRISLAHDVASREAVDAAYRRAVDAGARVLKEPTAAVWGGYHAYVADPDGFRWEIAYNPGLVVDDDGTVRFTAAGQ